MQHDAIRTPNTCEACKSANHYLKTTLSRVNNKNEISDPGRVRYDYMSKEELLNVARHSVKEMKFRKQKCQRLEEYRGKKTDNDLQTVFNKFYIILCVNGKDVIKDLKMLKFLWAHQTTHCKS